MDAGGWRNASTATLPLAATKMEDEDEDDPVAAAQLALILVNPRLSNLHSFVLRSGRQAARLSPPPRSLRPEYFELAAKGGGEAKPYTRVSTSILSVDPCTRGNTEGKGAAIDSTGKHPSSRVGNVNGVNRKFRGKVSTMVKKGRPPSSK